jgi:serine/threonine protein kinase
MLCAQCLRRLDTSAQSCPACMADPLLGGRYRLDRPLGEIRGESSYRATRVEDALLVRVRAVNLDHSASSNLARAQTAARIAKLEHRGLPRLLEQCELGGEPGRLCLIHEYVRGQTLLEFVLAEPERARDPMWLLNLLSELAGILAYLHGQAPAITHGRIAASTVLVVAGPEQRICLLDLQLSPSTSPAADLRALGVLLASLVSLPSLAMGEGTNEVLAEILASSSEPPPRWREHVDSQFASLIERMLANDAAHQISSAALREAAAELVRARVAEERRSPPTLARPLRPTPRFVMLESVPNPDGSVRQAAVPVSPSHSRAAARRSGEDVPVMRPDELSRELSQAYRATAQLEQQKQKQNVFARVAVVLLVAILAALATYLAMHPK